MGRSVRAAQVSGVDAQRTIVITMAVSGALAGLIGLPELLGSSHAYGLGFPPGLGWTGISIAILGRNHPLGIVLGALLWAWLERAAQVLDLLGVPREVVTIMQAVIVLAVVVAWEVVRRAIRRRQQRWVSRAETRAGKDGAGLDDGAMAAGSRP
jgi:simple sugar transport system permease protein